MSEKTIGQLLFEAIEKPQGYAYISDGIFDWDKDRVIGIARGSLIWHEKCIKTLKAFLQADHE